MGRRCAFSLPSGELSRRLGYVGGAVLLATVGAWLVLRQVGPWLIEAAPDSRIARALIAVVAGTRQAPVADRLDFFDQWLSLALASGVLVSLGIAGAALAVRAGLHRRSAPAFNVAVFGLAALAIVGRDISFFMEPRFWAEEGSVYFQAALDRPALEALLAPHQGYFDIVANVAGLLATVPSLEAAPLVTTVIAFLVQLALVAAILLSNAPFLKSSLAKALAVVAVVIAGSNSFEIWLTTTNSHYYFPVLVFLVLCQEKGPGSGRSIRVLTAGFAGLASVIACFLLPLFLVRYYLRQQREDLLLFGVLGLATLVQLAAIDASYTHILFSGAGSDAGAPTRFVAGVPPDRVLRTILGYGLTNPIVADYSAPASLAVGAASIVLMVVAATRLGTTTWHFLAALWIVIVLSVVSSLQMTGGPRYAYAPAGIFLLFLLAVAFDDRAALLIRRLSVGLFGIAIAVWIAWYQTGLDVLHEQAWPAWAEEVRAWRSDPSRTDLQIHPDWDFQREQGITWVVRIDRAPTR
jgi:hypothetical protein